MSKEVSKSKVWTKPEVKRLGEIKDVAQQNQGLQQGGNKT